MFSRRIKMTAIGVLFFLTAVLSASGYVFGIFEEMLPPDTSTAVLTIIDLLTIVKNTFSSHPLTLSLFFIGLAVLDDLYYAFKYDNSQNDLSVRIGKYVKYLLTGLNIICCVNLLDTEGLNQKLAWVQENKKTAILTIAIMVVYVIVMKLLEKGVSAKHEQRDIHQAIQNNSDGIDVTNPPSTIIRHPFAYAYEQIKIDTAKKIIDDVTSFSNQNKSTNSQSKEANQDSPKDSKKDITNYITAFLGGLLFFIITIALIAFIVWGFRVISNGVPLSEAQKFIQRMLDIFSLFNTNADPIKIAALTFLLSIGGIIAVVLIFFVLIYGLTFVIRAWIYMLMHITDKDDELKAFYNDIQRFFSSSIRSVLRLLLFFPDFVETVEKTVLDSDEFD